MNIDWTHIIVAIISASIPTLYALRKNRVEIAKITSDVYKDVINTLNVELEKRDAKITAFEEELQKKDEQIQFLTQMAKDQAMQIEKLIDENKRLKRRNTQFAETIKEQALEIGELQRRLDEAS